MLSGSPGNSRRMPFAKAMIIGSAMRVPWIQPGRGSAMLLSMIAGRSITSGKSPRSSNTRRSASDFVNVYTSCQPSSRARSFPRSTSLSLTHARRSCSVRAATSSSSPTIPSSRLASVSKLRASPRSLEASSTSRTTPSRRATSACGSRRDPFGVVSPGGSSRMSPAFVPATYAVETCIKSGFFSHSRARASRPRVPRTFESTAASNGASKTTEAAE